MDIDTHSAEGTAGDLAGAAAGELSTRPPLDSTSQMENANGDDCREEVYQKIKSMREMYLSDLNDVYWKIASKVQQHPQNEQIEKLKVFKMSLERIGTFLRLNKHEIQLIHKEQLPSVEKHISFFLSTYRPQKSTSPLQGQFPQSSMQLQQPFHRQQLMQHQLLFHRHQLMQQQLMQQQLMQQQLMQQQIVQFPAHQAQLHQMTDANDLKVRQQIGMKTGVLQQQQSVGQRVGSLHPQLKSGISSPQLHQAQSPLYGEKVKEEEDAMLSREFEPYTSAVEDFSAQMGNANEADWQEEVYQKIKSMKEMYLPELSDICQNIASAVQQNPQGEKIEKLNMIMMTLEPLVIFLLLKKHEIQLRHKENLLSVEQHISLFLSGKRLHKPTSSPLQGKLPQPSMHTSQAQNTYAHQTPTMDSGGQEIASEFDRLLSLID